MSKPESLDFTGKVKMSRCQDVFYLRIYKRIKSLNFNDSLKNTYNSKNTSHLDFSKGQSDSKP